MPTTELVVPPQKADKASRRNNWTVSLSQARRKEAKGWQRYTGVLIAPARSPSDRISTYRMYRALDQLRDYIDIDPERRGGVPVLRGTRFKVSQLFSQLAEGDSISDLVENLDLDGELLTNLLHALSAVVDRPSTHESDPT